LGIRALELKKTGLFFAGRLHFPGLWLEQFRIATHNGSGKFSKMVYVVGVFWLKVSGELL
jgi:hypothetical protein